MNEQERTLSEKVIALDTMIGARKLLRKQFVTWLPKGPDSGEDGSRGQHCALTAINWVARNENDDQNHNTLAECMVLAEANKRWLKDAMLSDTGGGAAWAHIPEWNDARIKGRIITTKRKVLSVFTSVIKALYNSLPRNEKRRYKRKI